MDKKIINVTPAAGSLSLSGQPPEVIAQKIKEAIRFSSEIPQSAKQAYDDFVDDNIEEIISKVEQLLNINVPEELIEYWPVVADIIKRLFS